MSKFDVLLQEKSQICETYLIFTILYVYFKQKIIYRSSYIRKLLDIIHHQ